MDKIFLTLEEQIGFLESKKNLVIDNYDSAVSTLKHIGYFSLINGYKTPFKNPTTKKFKDNTSFSDILALYRLDEELRELFLKYILQIECHIRSLLSYYFSDKHGEQQAHYLDKSNYTITDKRSSNEVLRLISMLDDLANRNQEYSYINHYRIKYRNVPIWVLVNGITLGTLSKFYSLTTSDIKVKVSKCFEKVNEKQLEQYLRVITKFRNVCAHNERLYSYKTKNDIPNTDLHKKLNIQKTGEQYICGKKDLFAIVIAFRYLLSNDDFKKFKARLTLILSDYLSKTTAMTESELYGYMGFPDNWKRITAYKK